MPADERLPALALDLRAVSGERQRVQVGVRIASNNQLARLHAPIGYFIGGPSDIAYPNAIDDWSVT